MRVWPPFDEEPFHQLGLGERGKLLHHWKRADERVEHGVRELDHELLGAGQRRTLSAAKVGQPVHKVKGHVGDAQAATRKQRLELRELVRRSLCLN
eukprot:scaffold30904_cov88-Phaeocystis_antarctica.AAC.2